MPEMSCTERKIKIGDLNRDYYKKTFEHHRSGWAYAVGAIQHLHSEKGILLDSFLDKKFAFGDEIGDRYNAWAPYREPWIGFFHNPPFAPEWFGSGRSAEAIMATPQWCESLTYCQGLFTLSKYLADWLRPRVTVPVCSLFHPTEACATQFSMDNYRSNPNRQLLHIGFWLRKFHSFFLIRTRSLQKLLLLPISRQAWPKLQPQALALLRAERALVQGATLHPFRTEFYTDNETYDRLLSRNIVFLDLYDTSANNVIVECITRATPLVVTRHPAVVEYLGEDYPLYINRIEDAGALAEDEQRIEAAYLYLRDHHSLKERLTGEYFAEGFVRSDIYQQLSA